MLTLVFAVVVIAFFRFAKVMSQTRLGNCVLLTLFLFLGTGLIWNARANQYILKVGQRTTANVIYSTWESGGRFVQYGYRGAGRGNPLHLFNAFFAMEGQAENIGTAIQAVNFDSTSSQCPTKVTIAYLPNNPRAHVVVEDCSTEAFYCGALLCLAAIIWIVLNLVCLIREEASPKTSPMPLTPMAT